MFLTRRCFVRALVFLVKVSTKFSNYADLPSFLLSVYFLINFVSSRSLLQEMFSGRLGSVVGGPLGCSDVAPSLLTLSYHSTNDISSLMCHGGFYPGKCPIVRPRDAGNSRTFQSKFAIKTQQHPLDSLTVVDTTTSHIDSKV